MGPPEVWGRLRIVADDGSALGAWVIERSCCPDFASVDQVARLQLLAAKLSGRVVFDEISPELRELVELAGLAVET
ncbi:MAG: hypothetical protein WAM97_04190 [Acidimicrobiales bacterium]|jgi:hypothetical protein